MYDRGVLHAIYGDSVTCSCWLRIPALPFLKSAQCRFESDWGHREIAGRRGFRTTASALRTRFSVTSCQNTPAAEHVNLHFCCHITGSISRSCTSRKLTSFANGFRRSRVGVLRGLLLLTLSYRRRELRRPGEAVGGHTPVDLAGPAVSVHVEKLLGKTTTTVLTSSLKHLHCPGLRRHDSGSAQFSGVRGGPPRFLDADARDLTESNALWQA
jgi:hypothetical protein